MKEPTEFQSAMSLLRQDMKDMQEQCREDVVEHVDHILSRVRTRVWELSDGEESAAAAVMVANAIDDVLSNKDR